MARVRYLNISNKMEIEPFNRVELFFDSKDFSNSSCKLKRFGQTCFKVNSRFKTGDLRIGLTSASGLISMKVFYL